MNMKSHAKALHAKMGKHDSVNRLTGSAKDELRKKFGKNRLSGSELGEGRKAKAQKYGKN